MLKRECRLSGDQPSDRSPEERSARGSAARPRIRRLGPGSGGSARGSAARPGSGGSARVRRHGSGSGGSARGPAARPGVRRLGPGSGGLARGFGARPGSGGSAPGSAARSGVRPGSGGSARVRRWWRGMSRGGGVMVHGTGQTGQSAGHGTPTAPRARLCGRPAPGAAGGEWLQAHRPRSQPSRSVPRCDVQPDQSGHGQSAFPAAVQAGQIQPTAGPGHTDRCRRQQGAGPTADARRKNSDILDQSQPQTLEMKNIPASVH